MKIVLKNFWTTSSFMAPFYQTMKVTSDWLVKRGVNRKAAEDLFQRIFFSIVSRLSVFN